MEYAVMLASAFGLGAAHALEPGHGKTVVAAYLVGSKGRTLDAIILGGVVTFTHTFSVMLLAIFSTIAAAYFVPEQVERSLAIGSGLLVTAVGAWMIYVRSKHGLPVHSHTHGGHSHDSDEHGPEAYHRHDAQGGGDHHHDHGERRPNPDPATDGTPRVGLGSLVALGISGGIVPCPAAMLLIPVAIGLGAVLKGLGLIVSFSLGLALVLMAIGILTLKAAGFASKWLDRRSWVRRISIASACLITLLGLALTLRAFLLPPEMH